MTEYIEREALKRAVRKAFPNLEMRIEINSIINEQPTADVVEVVRCKDCKFWQTDWETSYDGYHYCSMIDVVIAGDFYCKDGERKILPKD